MATTLTLDKAIQNLKKALKKQERENAKTVTDNLPLIPFPEKEGDYVVIMIPKKGKKGGK